MKILILGQDGHGKTTLAELLSKHSGRSFMDSSRFAMKKAVWPFIGEDYGSMEECFNDVVNRRPEWKRLISEYNTPDKSRLCREMLEVADFYVGMRCPLEYAATKHLFNLVVFCDGSKRTGYSEGSLTIPYEPGNMVRMETNGTIEELEIRVKNLVAAMEKQP